MKNLIVLILTLISSAAIATCDVSENETTPKKYSYVLKASETGPYAKLIPQTQLSDLPAGVLNCLSEVDLGIELGDGYYDRKFRHLYEIYYPNSKRVAGYIEVSGWTYTEATDPNKISIIKLRYNRHGQRITKVGEY